MRLGRRAPWPTMALVVAQPVAAPAAGTGRAKRAARPLSAKKAEQALTRLVDDQKLVAEQRERQWLWDKTMANPELLLVCRAAIEQRADKKKPAALRRGCRFVKDVPDYVQREFLAKVVAMDKAEVSTLSRHDARTLFRFCIADKEDLKVPELCMPVDQFMTWASARWSQHGSRCKSMALGTEGIDWEWTTGAYSFVRGEEKVAEDSDDEPVQFIVNNITAEKVPMPEHLDVTVGTAGYFWAFNENWSEESACLVNAGSGQSQEVARLFKKAWM